MAVNHGVNVSELNTSVSTTIEAESGIPYVVGTAPVQSADNPATLNRPVYCTSWSEAVDAFGYSDDWDTYTLCEAMYTHFKLYGCQPIYLCNVLDVATMTEAQAATAYEVSNHKVYLPIEAINDENLVVSSETGETTYTKDTDYSTFYSDEYLVVELLSDGTAYDSTSLQIAYNYVTVSTIKDSPSDYIAEGIENVDYCMPIYASTPDLILAPGFSHDTVVAALMATKAANINGLFKAKALIDIQGATSYSEVYGIKTSNNYTDSEQIVCWSMTTMGDYKIHMSTQLAGLMATVDDDNDGRPYESPSNKTIECDGLCLEDGTEVILKLDQANTLNDVGVVTALNFINGWTAWGNYTAAYPSSTDVKDYFIPVSRMFKWVSNSLIKTFWSKVDKPMNRLLVDTVVDTCNIWMNGLVGSGCLLGGRVEALDSDNTLTNLMAGKIKLHVYMTPPSPAQEIDFETEYDSSYVTSALSLS